MEYVAYYRVSTQKQGQSGLGLEAQQSMVQSFVKDGELIAEFTDIESGKKNNRPELLRAIDLAKEKKAKLLIAKLDRLSRNAGFIFALRDSGVDFVCCDMPDANTLNIGIFAVMAQHERELISQRTKAALAELKKKGKKLGNPQTFTEEVMKKGQEAHAQKAKENLNNRKATALILSLRKAGQTFQQIADTLNEGSFLTANGKLFKPMTVKRLWDRISEKKTKNH